MLDRVMADLNRYEESIREAYIPADYRNIDFATCREQYNFDESDYMQALEDVTEQSFDDEPWSPYVIAALNQLRNFLARYVDDLVDVGQTDLDVDKLMTNTTKQNILGYMMQDPHYMEEAFKHLSEGYLV